MSINAKDNSFLVSFTQAINKWSKTVKQIKLELINTDDSVFDVSAYNIIIRELEYLKLNYKNEKLIIVTDSLEFEKIALYFLTLDSPWLNVSVLTLAESRNIQYVPDYCLYFMTSKTELKPAKGKLSTVIVNNSFDYVNLLQGLGITTIVFPSVNQKYAFRDLIWIVREAIRACLNAHNASIILPKYWSSVAEPFNNEVFFLPSKKYFSLDYNSYICLYTQAPEPSKKSQNGTVGKPIHQKLLIKDILMPIISTEKLKGLKKRHLDLKQKIFGS
jgi:hypothetical protein